MVAVMKQIKLFLILFLLSLTSANLLAGPCNGYLASQTELEAYKKEMQANEDYVWLVKLDEEKLRKMNGEEHKLASQLSVQERIAIRHYTAKSFKVLNPSLRKNPGYFTTTMSVLCSALTKLPEHVGKVFRATYLPEEIIAKYQVGKLITEDAFTSTSTNIYATGSFGFIIFKIQTKTGRDISFLSHHESESEILIPASTKFKVLKKTKERFRFNDHDEWVITMKEI